MGITFLIIYVPVLILLWFLIDKLNKSIFKTKYNKIYSIVFLLICTPFAIIGMSFLFLMIIDF